MVTAYGSAGGTISFRRPSRGGALGDPLSAREIISYDPFLMEEFNAGKLICEDIPVPQRRVDSSEWRYHERQTVKKWARNKINQGFNVLISQGSDKGQETAYELATEGIPDTGTKVVCVADQPIWRQRSDAPNTLRAGYLAATDGRFPGTYMSVNAQIIRASRAYKTGGEAEDGRDEFFSSHNYPILAYYDPKRDRLVMSEEAFSRQVQYIRLWREWASLMSGTPEPQYNGLDLTSPEDFTPDEILRKFVRQNMPPISSLTPTYFDFHERFGRSIIECTTIEDLDQGTTDDDALKMFVGKHGGIVGAYGRGGLGDLSKIFAEFTNYKLVCVGSRTPKSIADVVGYKASARAMKRGRFVPIFDASPDFMQRKMALVFASLLITGRDYINDEKYLDLARRMMLVDMFGEVSTDEHDPEAREFYEIIKKYDLWMDKKDAAGILREASEIAGRGDLPEGDPKSSTPLQRRLANSVRHRADPVQNAALLRILAKLTEKEKIRLPDYLASGVLEEVKYHLRHGDAIPARAVYAEYETKPIILLVEDEQSIADVYEMLLGSYGYNVIHTSRAEDALRKIKREGLRPDAVLADLKLPGMSGDKLLLTLYEIDPTIRMALISASTLDEMEKIELPEHTVRIEKGRTDIDNELEALFKIDLT